MCDGGRGGGNDGVGGCDGGCRGVMVAEAVVMMVSVVVIV